MPAYAYPIVIKREPQVVKYQKTIRMEEGGDLTLSKLNGYGITESDSFWTELEDSGILILYINTQRMETEEEVKARVEKAEKYMDEYNKRKQSK